MHKLNTNFSDSAHDLIWLLDRGYPKKPAIEIVGNKYRMNHQERMILYRGIFDTEGAFRRKKKLIDPFVSPPERLLVDCYNVLLTNFSYLKGMLIFKALDGYVRDISEVFGSVKITRIIRHSIDTLVSFIRDLSKKTEVCILIDKPKKGHGDSRKLLSYIEEKTQNSKQTIAVRMVKSVDREIKNHIDLHTVVATSDTEIIEIAHKAIDIPEHIITNVFRREILDLQSIVNLNGRQKQI